MKKFFATLMALCFTLSPVITFAATEGLTKVDIKDYETLNLQEVLEAEEIKPAFKSYSENDDQITIYLFRGQGCGYCQGFLKFLNSITNEYGKYFKLVSFDAWYIEENAELLTNVSEFLGQPAEGVPYVIIGDQVFPGYAEDYNEGIKAAITTLYNAKDKYDVFEEYNKYVDEVKKEEAMAKYGNFAINFAFVAIGTAVVVIFVNCSTKKILAEIESLKGVNKTVKVVEEDEEDEEEVKEVKKAVKKTTKKKK